MSRAWLARFGRTVAEHVLDAVDGPFAAPRTPGVEVSLAGQALGGASAEAIEALEEREAEKKGLEALSAWLRGGTDEAQAPPGESRALTGRDFLTGTSFALTGGTAQGGFGAVWGHGAVSRFDGREGNLTLDGEVASAMLGADWTRGRGTVGMMLAHSRGEGAYPGDGEVTSALTGLYPYGRYAETGFGADVGAGVAWHDPGSGLSVEVRARGLLNPDNLAGAAAARWLALSPDGRERTGLMAPSHALRLQRVNEIVRERLTQPSDAWKTMRIRCSAPSIGSREGAKT